MIQMKNKRCNKLNMDLFCTFYTTYLPESVSNYKIQACLGTALVSFPRHRLGCSVQSRTSGLGPRHADRPSGGRPQTNLHTVLAELYSQRTLKETSKKLSFHQWGSSRCGPLLACRSSAQIYPVFTFQEHV